jgi:glycosyltransferase involved in cell wall biosynthesis
MDLSIVIPSRGNWSRLKFTLNALAKQALPTVLNWEVITVFDGVVPADYFLDQIFSYRLRYLLLAEQRGRGAARNAGIAEALGEFVILLDEDIIVGPRFLVAHLSQQEQSPSLCHGPLRELPVLAWIEDLDRPWMSAERDTNPPRRIREWALRVLQDLDEPTLCFQKHGQLSRLEKDGMKAFRQGRKAVAWVGFAGANLSAPRTWLIDCGFDERPGARWGLEDLSLALRWNLANRPLTVADDAWGLHLSHPRRSWRAEQLANLCCLDFLPLDVALAVLTYLEGKISLDDLEPALESIIPEYRRLDEALRLS